MRNRGGFVAGTLVHTDKGLVPIEQIKVGDMVLSKHESGEVEHAFKRVLSTFKSVEKKKIYAISFVNKLPQDSWDIVPDTINEFETVYLTDNHPIWVQRVGDWAADILAEEQGVILEPNTVLGWQQAKDIRAGMYIILSNGQFGCVNDVNEHVFSTDVDGLYYEGSLKPRYIVDMRNASMVRYFIGEYFDDCLDSKYADKNSIYEGITKAIDGHLSTSHKAVREFMDYWDSMRRVLHEQKKIIDTSTPPQPQLVEFIDPQVSNYRNDLYENVRARTSVYNIEVEDFHTYYVGELGLWVHNKN